MAIRGRALHEDEFAPDRTLLGKALQRVCLSCNGSAWVDGHWTRFENTLKTTNEMTFAAIKILFTAWENGVAQGLAQNESIFNEDIEKKLVEQWLFFANSTRFASAMSGGGLRSLCLRPLVFEQEYPGDDRIA